MRIRRTVGMVVVLAIVWATVGASLAFGDASTDEKLKTAIEKRLRMDDRIDWEVLDVEVQNGQAILYGEVRTPEERGLAAEVATTVPGIKGLTNSILVEPALSPDHKLTKAIWEAWRTVPVLRDNDTLRVSVKHAVAKLRGNVENSLQKKAADDAAASVPGVKVLSRIQVKADTTGLKDKGTEKMREEGVQAIP